MNVVCCGCCSDACLSIVLPPQMQCKLFVFDKTAQSWIERGRGLLRLNDMASTEDGTLQSRLGTAASLVLKLSGQGYLPAQRESKG